jgi:hypothetical protein
LNFSFRRSIWCTIRGRVRATASNDASSAGAATAPTHGIADLAADKRFNRFRRRLPGRAGLLTSEVLVGTLEKNVEITFGIVAASDAPEGPGHLKGFDGRQTIATEGLPRKGEKRRPARGVLALHDLRRANEHHSRHHERRKGAPRHRLHCLAIQQGRR